MLQNKDKKKKSAAPQKPILTVVTTVIHQDVVVFVSEFAGFLGVSLVTV